jgi:hypothetical protein
LLQEAIALRQIVVNVLDDKALGAVLELLRGLPNVEAQSDGGIKKWSGNLSGIGSPVHIENFRMFSREELHY